MMIWDYLLLGWRNKFFIISVIIAITALGYLLTTSNLTSKYSTTIFISVAVKDETSSLNSSTLENLQAADLFAETLQGWFKNPNFIRRIEDSKLGIASISAKKQEKQNLLINFETPREDQSKQAEKVILENLNSELTAYNLLSDTDFTLALANSNTAYKPTNKTLQIAISFFIGFVLSCLFAYLLEKSQRLLINKKEMRELSKHKPLFEYKNLRHLQKEQKNIFTYLSRLYDKKDIQFIVLIDNSVQSSERLSEQISDITSRAKKMKKNVEFLYFPEQISELKSDALKIIICVLGKTSADSLEKLVRLNLFPQEFIILNKWR